MSPKNRDKFNTDCTPITNYKIDKNKTMSECLFRWKSMVGNQFNSDITIFTKNECEIPVHTLVLFVQCPKILEDVITEQIDACKPKKMIMWFEYSYEACLAFLELIYSGQESFISPEFKNEYFDLGRKYNILMAVDDNDDEKCGWISEEKDSVSKRKNTEICDGLTNCKRYKSSSPDMFLLDNTSVKTSTSYNFLGTTVNDEKSLSTLKTKQWLDSCCKKQSNHNSSFTEERYVDVLPEDNHSFHSASTVSLQHTPISNVGDYNTDPENNDSHIYISSELPPTESNEKTAKTRQENKSVSGISTNPIIEVPTMNSCKQPDIITICSDSDSESIHMFFPGNIKRSCNSNTVLSIDLVNENNCIPLSQSSKKIDITNIDTIELSDDSSKSIYSASTNILKKKKKFSKSYQSSCNDMFMSSPKNSTLINVDDNRSIFSAVTNLLPISDVNEQIIPLENNNIIDLVEDSSDSISVNETSSLLNDNSTRVLKSLDNNWTALPKNNLLSSSSFSVGMNVDNSSCTIKKTNDNPDFNSISLFNINKVMSEDNLKTSKQINLSVCDHKEQLIFNDNNILNQPSSESLKNTIVNISSIPNSNNFDDSFISTNKLDDFNSSSNYMNKDISVNSVSTQVKLVDLPDDINTSKISFLNENNHAQDESNSEQIIDDPWVDYWMPVNIDFHAVSPVINEVNSVVDKPEVLTPIKQDDACSTILNLPTPSDFSNSNIKNSQKKNTTTPNKYGSRMNTPKTIRRVQSESVIGSKDQVTPLPDYSTMKTPLLRVSLTI